MGGAGEVGPSLPPSPRQAAGPAGSATAARGIWPGPVLAFSWWRHVAEVTAPLLHGTGGCDSRGSSVEQLVLLAATCTVPHTPRSPAKP